ncbi:hypothetical protein ABBQ32_005544 [Trebouxia sp. C0010 RCD-2024]
MAARASGNLPLDLPQPAALGSATQADTGSVKNKRKRASGEDGQAPHQGTGDVCMSDKPKSADGEEGSTCQQAPAKRMCQLGAADPLQQTQAAAMHAAHAKSAGIAAQSPQPDAAAVKRSGVRRKAAAWKQAGGPVRRSERLAAKREGVSKSNVLA